MGVRPLPGKYSNSMMFMMLMLGEIILTLFTEKNYEASMKEWYLSVLKLKLTFV